MSNALKNYTAGEKTVRSATPVGRRTPGRTDEVKNNTGGFTFAVSDKTRLERFLILGTEGGTYYVGEQKLTRDNAKFVSGLIQRDEALVLNTLVEVSTNNRAAKQNPAIFTLALLLVEGQNKAATRAAVNSVVRTGTHLFTFANFLSDLGGWGRSKRGAVADWYTGKTADQLAYQVVKYRSREGYTHRDLFRLSHPKGVDERIGDFVLGVTKVCSASRQTDILDGFRHMQGAGSAKEVIATLNEYKNLPWETIPTQFLKDSEVWKTLFYNGAVGQTALLRNVTRFEKIGAFNDIVFAGDVAKALADADKISKGRVHPVAYANALGIYRDGRMSTDGYYGSRTKDWNTNAKVLGALEAGFYEAFKTIVPANKATMVSVDVSGSMTWGAPAGLVGMDYMGAAAVMAMVTVRSEPYVMVNAFSDTLKTVNVSDTDSLETVVRKFRAIGMGATNISLPMIEATRRNLGIDTFAVYTDNEVNRGIKPSQALVQYRKHSGRQARLAIVGLASTGFSVADPKDSGQMDFVGFDASAPAVMADFSAGRL